MLSGDYWFFLPRHRYHDLDGPFDPHLVGVTYRNHGLSICLPRAHAASVGRLYGAEKHVAEEHNGKKLFEKNVREDEETKKQIEKDDSSKKMKKKDPENTRVSSYEPYKCGLCDVSSETVESIRIHCSEVHEMTKQFK